MKRIGGLREKFLNKGTILDAIVHLTSNSKRNKWTFATEREWNKLLKNKEALIDEIYNKLLTRTYSFQEFKIFNRNESKKVRHIYASHVKDQIVDYILDECLKYVFMERKKIIHPHCYGSIKNRGQHELRKKVIDMVKGQDDIYVAVCDTKKYYPTINQEILIRAIERHIKDPWCLWLCRKTIRRMPGGRGLALGLATSNILGHLYHAEVDWIITQEYGFKNYFRFCDDKILISKDKNLLHTMIRVIRDLVETKQDQQLKKTWKVVGMKNQGIEILGAYISSGKVRILSYKRRRIERKFKKEMNRTFDVEKDCDRVLRTWGGLKGSFKDIEMRNLIRYWVMESPFQKFFVRLYACFLHLEKRKLKKKYERKQ